MSNLSSISDDNKFQGLQTNEKEVKILVIYLLRQWDTLTLKVIEQQKKQIEDLIKENEALKRELAERTASDSQQGL